MEDFMRGTLLTAAAILLAACASATGPEAAGRFDKFNAVETTDFRSYERVQVLAPVAGPDVTKRIDARRGLRSNERVLSQRDVDAQLAGLHQDLIRAIGREAQIVGQGGEGILTIKTVVTELDANRPTQAELSDNPGLSIQSISTGRAAVEMELSENGRVLATLKDRDNVSSLADLRVQGAGIWTTANRFFASVSEKVSALLRD